MERTWKTAIKTRARRQLRAYKTYKYLLILMLPALVWYIIFAYQPMYGLTIAFKDFQVMKGVDASPWVGLKHFERMFSGTSDFFKIMRNTLMLSFYNIIFGFPAPIILAVLLSELRSTRYKKVVQSITYMPYFFSWVVLAGILREILSPSSGAVNQIIQALGGQPIYFLTNPNWFLVMLVATGIWRGCGWDSVVYLASITNIDPQLYEAATIDGASRLRQIRSITLPCLMPVINIMLIMRVGAVLNSSFDQIFNLYSPAVYETADVIDTYVYRVGLVNFDYSFSTAVGLFKNVIGLILVLGSDRIAKKMGQSGLF